jgi:CRP/FNR family transcriptional regulator, anaerobic regulatory protein
MFWENMVIELSPDERSAFQKVIEGFETKSVGKKTLLVCEGTVCKHLYLIKTGMIRTFVNHDGDEVTTWVALAGTIETSAQSFLSQTASKVNVETLSDCELTLIDRSQYDQLLKSNTAFNEFAIRMLERFYLRMEDKFYSYLFLSAEERYKKMSSQFPGHFEQVPLKYLASILRIKPETLSRLRKKTQS